MMRNESYSYLILLPNSALINPFSAVALFFIKGKLLQYCAGEIPALTTVCMSFFLTASFHRAAVAPKGFLDLNTAAASHLLPKAAFPAQNSTS